MMAVELTPEWGEIHEPIGVASRSADPSLHLAEYRNAPIRPAIVDRRLTFRAIRD
jgi:hypothetical protein